MTSVSVVIPTYNKLSRLSLVLATLARQTYPTDRWEVVIADDGSTDGTAAHLASHVYTFRLRCLSAPRAGRSAARNRGLQHATSDIVVFIDDDMLLPPEFVAEHARLQGGSLAITHGRIVTISELKFFADPSRGVFYSELARSDDAKGSVLRENCLTEGDVRDDFDRTVRRHTRVTAMEALIESVLTGQAPGPAWIGFTGGNIAAPRPWLLEVDGFDCGFGLAWGSEDIELGYRLSRAGRPFRYSHSCVNYHVAHHRFRFDEEQRHTSQYFADKHDDPDVSAMIEFIAGRIDRRELLHRFADRRVVPQAGPASG